MSSGRSREQRELDKLKDVVAQYRAAKDTSVPTDPVKFFQEVLEAEPYPHQKAFLEDQDPCKVVRWCRRAGKTFTFTGADLHFAALHPGSTTIVTMPKFNQIKEVYFQSDAGLHAHLARMDRDYYKALIKEELQTIIRFNNGAKIIPETPEPFTIRGHGPERIDVDEMNFIRKDWDLWLSALLPMTLTRVVYINIASTPWNKDSVYHSMCFSKDFDMFSGNVHHPDGAKYLRTWRDLLKPNGPLDRKQVDIMRKQYRGDPWRWKREMECAFVSDETAFLPASLIIKCQNSDLNFAEFEEQLDGDFYLGWDLGRETNPGALAVIDVVDDVRRLVHCKQFKLKTPYATQMGYIKSLCDRWHYTSAVYYDHTGTKGIDEQIRRAGFPRLGEIDFTKSLKHSMAKGLKDLMMTVRREDREQPVEEQRRQFELPYDQDVQAELNVVQWEQSPGSELYTFSHPEGSYDDRFWAVCLAILATLQLHRGAMEVDTGRVPR
jgi:phage FluMu gp28-like protein